MMSKTHSTAEFGDFSTQRKLRPAFWWLGVPYSRLLKWQQRVSDRNHLAQLTDRELEDVGLTRADVASEITKPFWCA